MRKKEGIRIHLEKFLEELGKGLASSTVRDAIIPHDTLHFLIDLFKKHMLIYEAKDGKYYFLLEQEKEKLRKEYQEFVTPEEYNVKLEHSKKILKTQSESPFEESNLNRGIDVMKNVCFVEHLKTGYPEVYEQYEKWEKMTEREKKEFASHILSRLLLIFSKVENGEPLRGQCELCPKITIGRKS